MVSRLPRPIREWTTFSQKTYKLDPSQGPLNIACMSWDQWTITWSGSEVWWCRRYLRSGPRQFGPSQVDHLRFSRGHRTLWIECSSVQQTVGVEASSGGLG